jgi:hypothetical protein
MIMINTAERLTSDKVMGSMLAIKEVISPYLHSYISGSNVLEVFGSFTDTVTQSGSEQLNGYYKDGVLSVTEYKASCSTSDNDKWDDLQDIIFHVNIRCVEHVGGLVFCIDGVYVPSILRENGIASKVFEQVSIALDQCGITDKKVCMEDTSPDYDSTKGISSHLCAKYGMTYHGMLTYDLGLTMN